MDMRGAMLRAVDRLQDRLLVSDRDYAQCIAWITAAPDDDPLAFVCGKLEGRIVELQGLRDAFVALEGNSMEALTEAIGLLGKMSETKVAALIKHCLIRLGLDEEAVALSDLDRITDADSELT